MKLFSRKESKKASAGRGNSSRSDEQAQLDTLRGRARRRLIGALVLVVAAVIVVPLLIGNQPEPEQSSPIVVPTTVPPMPDEPTPAPSDPDLVAVGPESPIPDGFFDDSLVDEPTDLPVPPLPEDVLPEPIPEPEKPTPAPEKPKASPQAEKPARAADGRTDDGSVAIALLEGRSPGASQQSNVEKGNFVLQIAAYTSSDDANARRDKLRAEGVSNAFVEQASPGGKTTWRLRVGPFPTREAAQAAQTRLRALGYENSFISSK